MSDQKFIRVRGRVIPIHAVAGVGVGAAAGAGSYLAHKNSLSMAAKAANNIEKYSKAKSYYTKAFSGLGSKASSKIGATVAYAAGDHKFARIGGVQKDLAKLSKHASFVGAAVAAGAIGYGAYSYFSANKKGK